MVTAYQSQEALVRTVSFIPARATGSFYVFLIHGAGNSANPARTGFPDEIKKASDFSKAFFYLTGRLSP